MAHNDSLPSVFLWKKLSPYRYWRHSFLITNESRHPAQAKGGRKPSVASCTIRRPCIKRATFERDSLTGFETMVCAVRTTRIGVYWFSSRNQPEQPSCEPPDMTRLVQRVHFYRPFRLQFQGIILKVIERSLVVECRTPSINLEEQTTTG